MVVVLVMHACNVPCTYSMHHVIMWLHAAITPYEIFGCPLSKSANGEFPYLSTFDPKCPPNFVPVLQNGGQAHSMSALCFSGITKSTCSSLPRPGFLRIYTQNDFPLLFCMRETSSQTWYMIYIETELRSGWSKLSHFFLHQNRGITADSPKTHTEPHFPVLDIFPHFAFE